MYPALTEENRGGAAPSATGFSEGAKTPKLFQQVYNIGNTTFYAEVKAGRLKVVKIGRKTLILRDDELAWLSLLKKGIR